MAKQVLVPVADAASDELWELSVAKDRELKRQELNALRVDYHVGQSERLRHTMSRLVQYHEGEAEKLMKGREE